jgi:hypothetical protein
MTTKLPRNATVAKRKSEICHNSFTFPITVDNENFKPARVLHKKIVVHPRP